MITRHTSSESGCAACEIYLVHFFDAIREPLRAAEVGPRGLRRFEEVQRVLARADPTCRLGAAHYPRLQQFYSASTAAAVQI